MNRGSQHSLLAAARMPSTSVSHRGGWWSVLSNRYKYVQEVQQQGGNAGTPVYCCQPRKHCIFRLSTAARDHPANFGTGTSSRADATQP